MLFSNSNCIHNISVLGDALGLISAGVAMIFAWVLARFLPCLLLPAIVTDKYDRRTPNAVELHCLPPFSPILFPGDATSGSLRIVLGPVRQSRRLAETPRHCSGTIAARHPPNQKSVGRPLHR